MRQLFNREVAGKGLILSQVCVIASLPYLYYMYFIGMREIILKKFLTQIPLRFEVAKGTGQLCAVIVEIDTDTGAAKCITRIQQTIEEKVS